MGDVAGGLFQGVRRGERVAFPHQGFQVFQDTCAIGLMGHRESLVGNDQLDGFTLKLQVKKGLQFAVMGLRYPHGQGGMLFRL